MDKTNVHTQLALVINELIPVYKNNENPHFNSKFADLNQLLHVVKPLCFEHGLTLTQLPFTETVCHDGCPVLCLVGVKTVLIHAESETDIESVLTLPCEGLNPQKAGGAITYAKRYSIKAMFLMEDVDDDAEASMPTPEKETVAEIVKQAWPDLKTIQNYIHNAITFEELTGIYKRTVQGNSNLSTLESNSLINLMRLRKEKLGEK